MELARWLSNSTIFGARDRIVEGLTEAWCIVKIRCPIRPVDPPVKPQYEDEFDTAEYLEKKHLLASGKWFAKGRLLLLAHYGKS